MAMADVSGSLWSSVVILPLKKNCLCLNFNHDRLQSLLKKGGSFHCPLGMLGCFRTFVAAKHGFGIDQAKPISAAEFNRIGHRFIIRFAACPIALQFQ